MFWYFEIAIDETLKEARLLLEPLAVDRPRVFLVFPDDQDIVRGPENCCQEPVTLSATE
jgi:hypothetical protein